MRAIQIIDDVVDALDSMLYQSVIMTLNYRRYVIGAGKIYADRGPPTNENGSPEVRQICELMGNVYGAYDIIHVTGTNGKGSVCLKLSNVLMADQKQIGLLTSPHINSMRERITINHKMISKYDFYLGIEYILSLEASFNKNRGKNTNKMVLICSEIQALLAFWYFNYKKVDVAILECNLGGKYDATNIIKSPLCSVITSVSLDHEDALGDTIESITTHKCGIMKHNLPVAIGPNVDYAFVEQYINDHNLLSPIYQTQHKEWETYNDINIDIAKLVLNILSKYYGNKFEYISRKADEINALLQIKPKGRLEMHYIDYVQFNARLRDDDRYRKYVQSDLKKTGNVLVMLDAAHNPNGIQMFFKSISNQYPTNEYAYRVIYGCKSLRKRENYEMCLKQLDGIASYVHFISSKRLLDVSVLNEYVFKNTKIVKDEMNPNGDVDLVLIHALMLCYRENGKEKQKQEIILCLGTMRSHSIFRRMIGIHDVYD
eukprot:224829_1